MQRTGFLPIVNTVLLVLILLAVALAMVMFDRQHETLRAIDANLSRQSEALVRLGDDLRSRPAAGVAAADGAGIGPDTAYAAAFARVLSVRDRPDYAPGDWKVSAIGQQIGKLTPVVDSDYYQRRVEEFVLESLLQRDPVTLEYGPLLAASWDVSDDGLTISFEMRKDARFSDGSPITSADVVYTVDLIQNPRINNQGLKSYFEDVSVAADGPHRVVFTLAKPYFQALGLVGGTGILSEAWYGRFTEDEVNAQPGLLFGSGPYRLDGDPEAWKPGPSVELVRNEQYWGPTPTLDRIVWRVISEDAAELVAFRNGEIDSYGIRPEELARLRDDPELNAKADFLEIQDASGGFTYVGWNQERDGKPTRFADKRVRQAMTLLLNRDEMASQLMADTVTVATGPFSPITDQADPGLEPWPYDPARAAGLLAEAGYEDRDGDGVLEDADGLPFRFTFIYGASNTTTQLLAGYTKDALARAGIQAELEPLEFNTMINRIKERSFDAITLGWAGSIESDPKQIFHSESIAEGGSNYVAYANPELDELIDTARVTVDDAERTAMWHRVHRILHEDQPYTFLFNRKGYAFVDKRFRNVQTTATGLNSSVEQYVPADEQRY